MNNSDFISPAISIGVPGIRTGDWEALVESIERAIKLHSFEIIFVGPYEPPPSLQRKSYVKYVQDFGCLALYKYLRFMLLARCLHGLLMMGF